MIQWILENNPKQIRTLIGLKPCFYLTNRFHVAVRLFSNRSQMTSKCGENKKVAHEAIAECVTRKKLWKHSPAAHVPTAFLILPNFHSCFYNSIETRHVFTTPYFLEFLLNMWIEFESQVDAVNSLDYASASTTV